MAISSNFRQTDFSYCSCSGTPDYTGAVQHFSWCPTGKRELRAQMKEHKKKLKELKERKKAAGESIY